MSPFREIAVLTPHSQNRQPAYRARKRRTERPGYGPTCVLRRFRAVRVEEVAADVQQALAHQKPETV